jgi:hypothetical protein
MTTLGASTILVFTVPLLAFGCGSSDSGNSTTGNPINLGGGGVTVITGNGSLNGGQVPITSAQVNTIKTSACAGESVEGESLPAVLELVIDVSSSMNDTAPGTNQSKWVVTRDALLNAVPGANGSSGLAASMGVGILFYPNTKATIGATPQDINKCVNTSALVPTAQLGNATGAQRTLVRTSIQNAVLQQSTPTYDAYNYAFSNGIEKTKLPGKRFMLLITDGTPTLAQGCVNTTGQLQGVDPEPIVGLVQKAADAGVKTFLIGSPGSEQNRNWLSRAAIIGGTAPAGCSPNGPTYCHMDMTTATNFSTALADGLRSISGQIAPCTYTFPAPPSGQTNDPNNINVIMSSPSGSQLVVRDDKPADGCTKGWQLTSNNEILLCSDTCKAVQADASTGIEVVFGCASLGEPPK